MNPIIFAGPSIHGVDRMHFDGFDIRPPARAGDLLRTCELGHLKIGLVDGEFDQAPSVWHKEILYALSKGVAVYGAASIGALRAAECHQFGMIGIGEIFEDYRSGRRTADADVAITHGPSELGFAPLTVAIVEIDKIVEEVSAKIGADEQEIVRIRTAARSIHFMDRTWQTIFEYSSLPEHRIKSWRSALARLGPSLKTRDAMLLVRAIQSQSVADSSSFTFSHTSFFNQVKANRK
jgi:hypothetical protein